MLFRWCVGCRWRMWFSSNSQSHSDPHTQKHKQTNPQTGPITIHCAAASAQCNYNCYVTVLEQTIVLCTQSWSETVGLRTRPVWDQKIGLGLGLGPAGLVLCCETRSCHARRHNDLEGHRNFSSTGIIYSEMKCFKILCLEHHYCGDQQWCLLA